MTRRRSARASLSAPRIIAIAVAIACLIKGLALDLVIVRGESMSPTIRPGSVALVARCAYGLRVPIAGKYLARWAMPAPGDVVLVEPTANGSRRAVKRVFELGPAFMRVESGTLRGRGGAVALGPNPSTSLVGSPYLPAGRAFIVGDNGASSFDSRDYGSVPIEKIAGKVILYSGVPERSAHKTDHSKDAADDVDR